MIVSVTLNPSVDHSIFVEHLVLGDTNRVTSTATDAGGKGVNLARIVAEVGDMVVATGFLGGDTGRFVEHVLDRQGVIHDFVPIQGATRMNVSVEDSSDGAPTTFNERGPEIDAEAWGKLLDIVDRLVRNADWLTVGGSLPPGVPQDAFAKLVRAAKEHGVRTALDADGEAMRLGVEAGPDFVKPNAHEAARLLDRAIDSEEDALAGARELHARGVEYAIVSRGGAGAVLACSEGAFVAHAPKVEVRSTIGSGDSLVGAFLASLVRGASVEESFRWGIAAGAATAMTDGSEIGRRADILALLDRVDVVAV